MKQLLGSGGFSLDLSWITDFVIEAMITWISNLVGNALDLFGVGLTGILSLDLTILEQMFTFLVDAYGVIRGFAMIMMWVITIFQLIRSMLGPITDAEEPLKLVARSGIFTFGVLLAKELTNYAIGIARLPYAALENVPGGVGIISFSSTQLSLGQMLGSVVDELIAVILAVLLIVIIAWNYLKLCLEAVARYVLLGFMVYTSPLAFSMGSAQVTKNIFSAWCKMVGAQIILMMANVFFLRGFAYAYALPIESFGQILANQGHPQSAVGATALWCFFLIAWLKLGQGIDGYLSRLGLSVAQTGGNMASELILSTHMLASSFHAVRQGIREVRNNAGGAQGERAVGGTANAATVHSGSAVQSGQQMLQDTDTQAGAGKTSENNAAIGQIAETTNDSHVDPSVGGAASNVQTTSDAVGKMGDEGGGAGSHHMEPETAIEPQTGVSVNPVEGEGEMPAEPASTDLPENTPETESLSAKPEAEIESISVDNEIEPVTDGIQTNDMEAVGNSEESAESLGVKRSESGVVNALDQEDGSVGSESEEHMQTRSKPMDSTYPAGREEDDSRSFRAASENAISVTEVNSAKRIQPEPVGRLGAQDHHIDKEAVPTGQISEVAPMDDQVSVQKPEVQVESEAHLSTGTISDSAENISAMPNAESVMQKNAVGEESSLVNEANIEGWITQEGMMPLGTGNEVPFGLSSVENEVEPSDALSDSQPVGDQTAIGENNLFAGSTITPTRQAGISRLDLAGGGAADVYAAEQYQEPVAPHTTFTDRDGHLHYVMQPTANYQMYDGLTPVQQLFKESSGDALDLSRAKNPDFSNIADGRFSVYGGTINQAKVKLNAYDTASYCPEGIEGKDYFIRQDRNGATWAFSVKRLKKYPSPKKRRK